MKNNKILMLVLILAGVVILYMVVNPKSDQGKATMATGIAHIAKAFISPGG
jgi:hypothetical protein